MTYSCDEKGRFMNEELIERGLQVIRWMGNNAALISVAVTLLLFFHSKKKENELKIYETKKNEYAKLIDFFQKTFSPAKKKEDIINSMILHLTIKKIFVKPIRFFCRKVGK